MRGCMGKAPFLHDNPAKDGIVSAAHIIWAITSPDWAVIRIAFWILYIVAPRWIADVYVVYAEMTGSLEVKRILMDDVVLHFLCKASKEPLVSGLSRIC